MIDSTTATELITSMLYAIDALDWPAVRRTFADDVEVDYTSLAGGQPARIAADQLMTNWRALLPGFDATQHLIGPILITSTGGLATAECHVRGYHYLKGASGGDVWMVAGHYRFQLAQTPAGWKIAAIRLTVFYQEGNLQLPALAQSRAAGPLARGKT